MMLRTMIRDSVITARFREAGLLILISVRMRWFSSLPSRSTLQYSSLFSKPAVVTGG